MSSLMAESLLIGSSNVYKIYKSGTHARDYKMIKCTKSESFEAHITNLTQESKFVLASVIENFVADEVTNEAEPDAEITHCMRTFLKTLGETATILPGTKFCVVMPMQRPLHNWYQDRIMDLKASLMKGIKDIQTKIGYDRLAGIEASPDTSQDFEPDGVHLTGPSAKIFLDHILYEAEAFFKGGTEHHMENDDDVTEVRSIEERLEALKKAHKKQVKMNFANNLMMARVREEIDSIGNRSNERAGRAFQGQLENNFVVLNDEDQGRVVGSAPGTSSHVTGRGRGKGAGPTGTNATPRGSGNAKGVKRPGSDLHSKPAKK
jgi:hypothetical protein